MADFNIYPQLQAQTPDVLGSYLKGAEGGAGIVQQGLNISQARMALGIQQYKWDWMRQKLAQQQPQDAGAGGVTGGPGDTGQGAPSMGRTGGIQNGPQDGVGGTATGGSGAYPTAPGTAMALGKLGQVPGGSPLLTPDEQREWSFMNDKYTPETEAAILKDQMERLKFQAAPAVAAADSLIQTSDPGLAINKQAALRQMWQQAGYTDDPARLDPDEVRQRIAAFRDQILAHSGQAPEGMPTTYKNTPGVGGIGYQVEASGKTPGKISTVGSQQLPGYSSQEAGVDMRPGSPTFGQTLHQMVMTSPGGVAPPASLFGSRGGAALSYPPGPAGAAPAAAAARGAPVPAAGAVRGALGPVGTPYASGYAAPSGQDTKEAGRAADFSSGVQKMTGLEQQYGNSVLPSAVERTAITQAVVGAGGILGAHEALQSLFLDWKLNPKKQEYLAAAIPVIEAKSYDEGGRFDEKKFKANMYALIPQDAENSGAMDQITQTRANAQLALDQGAKTAAFLPGNEAIAARARGTAKTVTQANVQDYADKHGISYQAALSHATTNGYTLK